MTYLRNQQSTPKACQSILQELQPGVTLTTTQIANRCDLSYRRIVELMLWLLDHDKVMISSRVTGGHRGKPTILWEARKT